VLTIVKPTDVKNVRDALESIFRSQDHEVHQRTLGNPSGSDRVTLLWLPKVGLWGHFRDKPKGDHLRWYCWFGTSLGDTGETLTASIEINLTVDPQNRRAGGRALTDQSGGFYLGHKGYLGGGRGGQMSMVEFKQRIRGFVHEPIRFADGREEEVFIIGSFAAPTEFTSRLRSYVLECERLRAFVRANTPAEEMTDDVSHEDPSANFSPEVDVDGTGSGYPGGARQIRRLHGRVVNALQRELGPAAVNSTKFDMRPDLYIPNTAGNIITLFEIKASSSAQSWFTALGQLVVYGSGQSQPPTRVLVCPAPRMDSNFRRALQELKIHLVTFDVTNTTIEFNGLKPFIPERTGKSSAKVRTK
jgi:hypothetical protein